MLILIEPHKDILIGFKLSYMNVSLNSVMLYVFKWFIYWTTRNNLSRKVETS